MSDIFSPPNATFYSEVDNAPTGLVGTIGVRIIRNGDEAEVLARTTAGIVEFPTLSGRYLATLKAPSELGDYTILWDTGTVSPETTAADELTVTYSGSPAAPKSPHSPDFEGFAEAQERKRQAMGQDVTFFIPTTVTWPAGLATDEEGVPLDPTVQPLSSGIASASARVDVAHRPVTGRLEDPSEHTAVGLGERTSIVLIASHADYESRGLALATEAEVMGQRYALRDRLPDQMGPGPPERMLIFAEKK